MKNTFIASLAVAAATAFASADIIINEVDYDNIGGDGSEFVELFNNGATPVNIGGWRVVLVNGSNDTFYSIITIPAGTTLAAGAYWVIGSSLVANVNQFFGPASDNIQNGAPDAIGLYTGTGSMAVNSSSNTNSPNLVNGFVYEGPDAGNYPGYTQLAGTILDSNTVNVSIGLLPNGTGSMAINDAPTPGAINTPTPGAAALMGVGMLAAGRRRRA